MANLTVIPTPEPDWMKGVEQTSILVGSLSITRSHFVRPYWTKDFDRFVVEGRKEDLVEAGVCCEEMFPQGRKRMSRSGVTLGSSRHWSIERKAGGAYVFFFNDPPEQVSSHLEELMRTRKPVHLRLVWSAA